MLDNYYQEPDTAYKQHNKTIYKRWKTSLLCGNSVLNMYADNSKINVIMILLKDGTHVASYMLTKVYQP